MLVCVFSAHIARETAGAASTRRSLRPRSGGRFLHSSGASRRGGAKAWLDTVIGSEANQSIAPRKERMDCFVAALLAMTAQLFEIRIAQPTTASSRPICAIAHQDEGTTRPPESIPQPLATACRDARGEKIRDGRFC